VLLGLCRGEPGRVKSLISARRTSPIAGRLQSGQLGTALSRSNRGQKPDRRAPLRGYLLSRVRKWRYGSSWREYVSVCCGEGPPMPIFLIERRFADEISMNAEAADVINKINDEENVRWLYSFLSLDKRKTYCLYEASSADAILQAARRAGIPADVITEIPSRVLPDGSLVPV
jgi:hypothetical protein